MGRVGWAELVSGPSWYLGRVGIWAELTYIRNTHYATGLGMRQDGGQTCFDVYGIFLHIIAFNVHTEQFLVEE